MASKQFKLDAETVVTIFKRRSNKNLKLSITPSGLIRLSIPVWASYASGINFALSKLNWIKTQVKPTNMLVDNQAVGKFHHIKFSQITGINKTSSKIISTQIIIKYPTTSAISDKDVQTQATRASLKALRQQAKTLLPRRLNELAVKYDFTYDRVTVKQFKSRWGSCDNKQHIVLNFFLMQLPWELIDYVLLHELAHTKVLKHGPDFWKMLESVSPKAKTLRKQINTYQPVLHSPIQDDVA